MYSAKISRVLFDGWYSVLRMFTSLSRYGFGFGRVCVCVVSYRLCHVMSCMWTDIYLPTYLLTSYTYLYFNGRKQICFWLWLGVSIAISSNYGVCRFQCNAVPSVHACMLIYDPLSIHTIGGVSSIHPSILQCSVVMQISFSSFLSLSLPSIPLNGWDGMGWDGVSVIVRIVVVLGQQGPVSPRGQIVLQAAIALGIHVACRRNEYSSALRFSLLIPLSSTCTVGRW